MKSTGTKLKFLFLLCALALGLGLLGGCGKKDDGAVTSFAQLGEPGRKIGVPSNVLEMKMLERDYPQAEIVPYDEYPLAYEAVKSGKLDAYVYARLEMQLAMDNGVTGVRLLDENYNIDSVVIGISPVSKIPALQDQINAFLAELRADGTLDDMYDRWAIRGEDVMPEIPAPEHPALRLRVGTTGTVMPYSYFSGKELRGYDIELAKRFAAWLGAELEFKIYDFIGIVSAAAAGDVDCIMSNLFYQPEAEESILFSDPLFNVEITAMVRDTGAASAAPARKDIHWQDYNGKRIGVLVGPLMEDAAAEFFPDSEYLLFNSYPDCAAALLAGKIDAFLEDEPGAISMHAEQPEIDYIHERLTENNYSFAFRKNDPESAALCAELNEFLSKSWADGTMRELEDIWLGVDEARKTVDLSGLTGENGVIKVVTTSTDMPWSYIKDGKNVGYDIDLAARFCRERGYALELGDVDFAGRIPALQSGRYDFTTDMNVTPEREEQVLFSDATSHGGIVLAVPSSDLAAAADGGGGAASEAEYQTFEELNGKTISMLSGAPFEELISSKVPNVKEFTYFTSMPDMMLAVESGKSDAGLMNNAVATLAANREKELALFPISLGDTAFGIGFAKGDERRDAWQEAYDRISEKTKEALWEKWTGADDSVKTLPVQDWPGKNGTVNVAACDALEPMSYVGQDGEVLGLDVETILLIAKELDVHVTFMPMDFSAVLSALGAEKADLICGSIVVTDERKEAMDFLEYLPASFLLIVRAKGADTAESSFFENISSSFERTFIRENRWQLFLQGIGTTLLITVLAILFGTAVGFAVYMLCRNGNPAANLLTRFFVWLVQGMPVVVLLMILYYIIFAKTSVSGTAVAVVGFTLVFASAVYGMLCTGVGAIPKGQTEAAYALGYGNTRAFFRIILPQAVPHFLPAYKGEIVALIKATAIVGYIAVQDLTKMGDIIRGRTYEAFFPLIAVAVIYFILAGILTSLVNRLEINVNPRRRKKEDVLKGLETP